MTRSLKGVDAVRGAEPKAARTVHVLDIDGIPCALLTVKEFAVSTRLHWRRVLELIHTGRIRALREGKSWSIPVSEIATVVSWADYHTA
jgi:excisionase family DNA binding protein